MESEKLSFWLILVLIVIFQAIDITFIPDEPFWLLYLHGGLVDASLGLCLMCIAYFSLSDLAIKLLVLQAASVIVHLSALTLELLYNTTSYAWSAQLCSLYTPALIAILIAKCYVLGSSGYGIYHRKRSGTNGRVYPTAIVVSSDQSGKISERSS